MQAKLVFLFTAIVGLFFGISLLLLPEFIIGLLEATYQLRQSWLSIQEHGC